MSFFGNIHGQGGHGRGLMWDSTLGGWRWTEVMSSRYRDIAHSPIGASTATQTSGNTYVLILGGTTLPLITANGGLGVVRLDPADYLSTALTTKLRLGVSWETNAVAPANTMTVSLQPISTTGGGAAVNSITVGAAVTSVAIATPAATSSGHTDGADVNFPAAGLYVLTLTVSGTAAASASTVIRPRLQYRYV